MSSSSRSSFPIMIKNSQIVEQEEEDLDEYLLHEMGYAQELYRGFSPFMSAGQLAPPRHAPLASFICGWFNFVGNVASGAAFSSGFSTIINTAVILDAGAHLAEETRAADSAAPKGIVGTCLCSAIVGITYLLSLLFAIPNVATFIKENNNNNSSINLAVATYQLAVPRRGALALTILLALNLHFGGMAVITVSSRIGFAMARDGVFPFSHYLRYIFEPTKTPLANVFLVFLIDSVLLLLQLVSTTAFTAIIAITTLGYQISYLIPILLRCTIARHTFPVGEFNLGRFGIPIAIISSIWLSITSIIMFFPANYPILIHIPDILF
ncbi:unnamed protein product [Rotaria sordida]|uniref:Amino acid permease n=1 Tax=Rotaria sordida TaxID=392033 RepID=A0A815AYZ2_9BILA|nr:unnamed protein product [Rotaria sordida]CAF1542856.1 unnamed protein product [Rotaria sordida]